MKNWLIKLLGWGDNNEPQTGDIPVWRYTEPPIDPNAITPEEKRMMRLIDYAINGVFFKLEPKRRPRRAAKPENITLNQLENRLRANLLPPPIPNKPKKKKSK